MKRVIKVPIKEFKGDSWAQLNHFAVRHEICGERFDPQRDYALWGGHRVRRYKVSHNVHWLIPKGIDVDISAVPPSDQPVRRAPAHRDRRR